ncbi:MAG: ATP-binding protein [Lachnospiraceae bacterium]|nr:ATP-binding protein [Lachnospiraceae bacterium]
MTIGRSSEIEYLKKIFNSNEGSLVTLYGRAGVGTSTVWREFVKDKKYVYIKCPKASARQISFLIGSDLSLKGFDFNNDFPTFNQILDSLFDKYKLEKFVLVIDDFENCFKADDSYIDILFSYLKLNKNDNRCMCLLVSHDTRYVENIFISKIGKNALSIDGFLKVRPLSFIDLVMFYNTEDTSKCMDLYALLGGNIAFYNYFDINKSLKENIIKNFLNSDSVFRRAGNDVVLEYLREVNVYATILYCLANGRNKLNDIYIHTGFSRAKISVYLKNLMSLDTVEKVSSFDTPGNENTMKGVYRISNPIVNFWFKFVYPHESYLKLMSPEKFYDTFINDNIPDFFKDTLPLICKEYLNLLNSKHGLPIKIKKYGEWVGKAGTIHYIGQDEHRNILAAYCALGNDAMNYSEFEWFDYCLKEAKIKADYIYLFSKKGFDEDLSDMLWDREVTFVDIRNL